MTIGTKVTIKNESGIWTVTGLAQSKFWGLKVIVRHTELDITMDFPSSFATIA